MWCRLSKLTLGLRRDSALAALLRPWEVEDGNEEERVAVKRGVVSKTVYHLCSLGVWAFLGLTEVAFLADATWQPTTHHTRNFPILAGEVKT